MKQKNNFGLLVLVLVLFISGCSFPLAASKTNTVKDEKEQKQAADDTDQLIEDKRVYENDKDNRIIDLYITVYKGESQTNFYNINHWYDNGGVSDPPKLDAVVQEGGPNGPQQGDWGYGIKVANSSIEIRGNSSRLVTQKSYKIKLAGNAGLWHGQTIINLNKHEYDITRVRQKLSFDFFKEIPNMASLRTQFVRLHVLDLSADNPDQQFADYGLYTQVEQPNKRFLYAHGLDPNGNLYKANFFEFFRYPDQLKLATDPKYNKKDFESILQIKGSEDHDKLLKMLDDVNDYKLDINDVVEKYFNRDNYLTWMAVNILMGNIDTDAQNFFLYNPLNSEKFYFLPWDYDAAWGQQNEENKKTKGFTASWQLGLSNYWGSVLHQRFFKDSRNVDDLDKKIEEVSNILNKQKIKEVIDKYYPIINANIKKSPDLNGLPWKIEEFDTSYQTLVNIPEQNKEIYYKNFENPMPIYLGDLTLENNSYQFTWDSSYDLQGDDLTYDLQISQSIDFSSVYVEQKNLSNTAFKVAANQLKKGKNYWRVIVKDSKGNTQIAFDRLKGEDDNWYNGEREILIN